MAQTISTPITTAAGPAPLAPSPAAARTLEAHAINTGGSETAPVAGDQVALTTNTEFPDGQALHEYLTTMPAGSESFLQGDRTSQEVEARHQKVLELAQQDGQVGMPDYASLPEEMKGPDGISKEEYQQVKGMLEEAGLEKDPTAVSAALTMLMDGQGPEAIEKALQAMLENPPDLGQTFPPNSQSPFMPPMMPPPLAGQGMGAPAVSGTGGRSLGGNQPTRSQNMNRTELESKRTQKELQLDGKRGEIDELSSQLNEQKGRLAAGSPKANEEAAAEYQQAQGRHSEAQGDHHAAKGDADHARQQLSGLRGEVGQARSKESAATSEVVKLQQQLSKVQGNDEDAKARRAELDGQLASARAEESAVKDRVRQLETEIQETERREADAQRRMEEAQARMDQALQEMQEADPALKQQIEDSPEIRALEQRLQAAQQEARKLEADIGLLDDRIGQVDRWIQDGVVDAHGNTLQDDVIDGEYTDNYYKGALLAGASEEEAQRFANDEYLHKLVHHESGTNHTAQNPTSSAHGLFQIIDSTWESYVGTDANDMASRNDPTMQAKGGYAYIQDAYGSPEWAYRFQRATVTGDMGLLAGNDRLINKAQTWRSKGWAGY